MSDSQSEFTYAFMPGDTLGTVATRFLTSTTEIIAHTAVQPANRPRFAWARRMSGVLELDCLIAPARMTCDAMVPVPPSQQDLEGVKVWRKLSLTELLGGAPTGDTPLTTLVAKAKALFFADGRLKLAGSDEDTAAAIWDYYGNATWRNVAACKGGMNDQNPVEPQPPLVPAEADGLWVPLEPPFDVAIRTAIASPGQPRGDAAHMVDVLSPDIARLGVWLREIDDALEGVVRAREPGRKSVEKAQALCVALSDLEGFMNTVQKEDHYPDWPTGEARKSRAAAYESLHKLQIAACEKMLNEAGNAVVNRFNPNLAPEIAKATDALLAKQSEPEGMKLLRKLMVPDSYGLPVHSLRTMRLKSHDMPSLCEYACALAARIAVTCADSPKAAHDDVVKQALKSAEPEGENSTSLLAYCLACTNERNNKYLSHPAIWSCLSVAAQIQAIAEVPKFYAGGGTIDDAYGFKNIIGNYLDRLHPLLVTTNHAPLPDYSHPELRARVKKLLDKFETPEVTSSKGDMLKLATFAMQQGGLDPTVLAGLVKAIKDPFGSAANALRIPKVVQDGASYLGVAYGVLSWLAGVVDDTPKEETPENKIRGALEKAKTAVEWTELGMTKANWLKKFLGQSPAFTEEGALAWCGRASFIVGAALSYYDAMRDLGGKQDGWTQAQGGLKLMGTNLIVIGRVATIGQAAVTAGEGAAAGAATAVEGVDVVEGALVMAGAGATYMLVGIGVSLIVVAVAIENRSAIRAFFQGKAQEMCDALMTDDAEHGMYLVKYADTFGFRRELDDFKGKFGRDYFNEAFIQMSNRAYLDAHGIGPKL